MFFGKKIPKNKIDFMISNLEKRRAKNCSKGQKVEIENVSLERDEESPIRQPVKNVKRTIDIQTSLFIDPKKFLNRRKLRSRQVVNLPISTDKVNIGQPASLYQSPRRQVATSNQCRRKYNHTTLKIDPMLPGQSFFSSSPQNSNMEESTRISATRRNERRSPLESEHRYYFQNSLDMKKTGDNLVFQPGDSDGVWPPLDQLNVIITDPRQKETNGQVFVPHLNIKSFKPRLHDLSQSIHLPGLSALNDKTRPFGGSLIPSPVNSHNDKINTSKRQKNITFPRNSPKVSYRY